MIAFGLLLVAAGWVQTAPASSSQSEAAPAGEELQIVRRQVSLDIPDEIAPAVIPYLECLMLVHHGPAVFADRPRTEPGPGGDCSPHRREATARADELLIRIGGRSPEQHRLFIEDTLGSFEAFTNPASPRNDENAED